MDPFFSMFIGVFSIYLALESYRKIGKSNTTVFFAIETVFLVIGYLVAFVLFVIVAIFAFLNVFG
jgi:hypothetical protein